MNQVTFQIEVPVGPTWGHIELLRTSVLNCLTTVFQSHDYCQTLSMVAGELLENAVKYGDWSRSDERSFRLRVQGDSDGVSVEVSNPVIRDSRELRHVLETVEMVANADSPGEAYRQRLFEIAGRNGNDVGGSGLGLVRVAYEAECSLAVTLDDGDILRVQATAQP